MQHPLKACYDSVMDESQLSSWLTLTNFLVKDRSDTHEKGSLLSKQMHVDGEFYQWGGFHELLVLVLISKNQSI
jgi:hypothetical protein